jgi:hypothetical protein
MENARLEAILESGAEAELRRLPGVVHVTTGVKRTGGSVIDALAILVYVRQKRPIEELAPSDRVPAEIAGVPTDVNVVPEVKFADDQTLYRPVIGGSQITNGIKQLNADLTGTEMHSGTLGCLATRTSDGKTVLLTNWHVLSHTGGKVGDNVYQPRPVPEPDDITDSYPKYPKSSENAIAKIALMTVNANVDAAIATINTCYSCCCNCGTGFADKINGLNVAGGDFIRSKGPATAGQTVIKVGKKTGRTQGTVVTLNAPSFTITRDGNNFTFTGQIEIAGTGGAFGQSGDSGSAVVGTDGKIVGLYFASSTTGQAFANHIANVESAMGIAINLTAAEGGFGSSAAQAQVQPPDAIAILSARLSKTGTGRELLAVVERHADEVLRLVNHRRAVTVVWHRTHGPQWVAHGARSSRIPEYRIPESIEGVTIKSCLLALGDILEREGSSALARDVQLYRPLVEAWDGAASTLDEMLEFAHALSLQD